MCCAINGPPTRSICSTAFVLFMYTWVVWRSSLKCWIDAGACFFSDDKNSNRNCAKMLLQSELTVLTKL